MHNLEDVPSRVTIDKDYLLEVYKAQWSDIHHNRTQDFEIAKLILGGFLGLSGLKAFGDTPDLTITVAIIFIIICLFGILIAIRHKKLFNEKMNAIKICDGCPVRSRT
ncbi:MAG: hypothetical protein IPJ37_06940 [Bacteroidales bacterium]|nr:hypothetical protein [Bacteroidales bacterium]